MAEVTALVLAGGGTRAAYEAGVVSGIVEVLGLQPDAPSPFSVFSGTSSGAINAAFLASHAGRGDLAAAELVDVWGSLKLGRHGRIDPWLWLRRGVLDASPIEQLVRENVDWDALGGAIDRGRVRALLVPALHVGTGRTAIFADLAPGVAFPTSRDPRRATVRARITAEHVLASAAIPGIYPPRVIGGRLFYDGGLRFNTPLSPAIRCGATRLVIVSPLHRPASTLENCACLDDLGDDVVAGTPSSLFLAGKMLDAILLDPIVYDMQVVARFNALLRELDRVLAPAERERLDVQTIRLRGAPYRPLDTLVISPSQDIGRLAGEFVRRHRWRLSRSGLVGCALVGVARRSPDTDLPSWLLFDGDFARELAAIGRADVVARTDEVRRFFAVEERPVA